MAKQYAVPNTFAFACVDVDHVNDLVFDIKGIPTFFFFQNGAKTSSLLMPNRTSLAKEVEKFAKTAKNATAVNGASWSGLGDERLSSESQQAQK
jgi:thioredoxin-like negative regulator of GroEL